MRRILSALVLALLAATTALAAEPLKILAIGNSFSEDAVEQNLQQIAANDGVETIIVDMVVGGCTLDGHVNFVENKRGYYSYRRINADGTRTTSQTSLNNVIGEEEWDIVTVQQASGISGQWDSYDPYLDKLVAWVRANVPAKTRILFYSTWAYAANCTLGSFANYGNSQETMYNSIIECTRKAATHVDGVIPVGTAIQNGRTSSIGDKWNRDGYHLNTAYGQYLAALTWWEVISGHNAEHITYRPSRATEAQAAIARRAAHMAVKHPWQVTSIDL